MRILAEVGTKYSLFCNQESKEMKILGAENQDSAREASKAYGFRLSTCLIRATLNIVKRSLQLRPLRLLGRSRLSY